MNVLLCSIIRGGRHYCERYVQQAKELAGELTLKGDSLRVVIGEGDSTDGTRQVLDRLLRESGLPYELLDVVTHTPWYGSTVNPARFKAKAYCDNIVLSRVRHGGTSDADDIVLFIEADLIADAKTLVTAINHVKDGKDVIALMPWAGRAFYDLWAYEAINPNTGQATPFGAFEPYHPSLKFDGTLTEITSAGSCFVMRAEVARIPVPEDEEFRSWSKKIREAGYKMYTSPVLRIHHPA